jgi:hypothetical protein
VSEALSVEGRGCELFELMCTNDLEGIVAKKRGFDADDERLFNHLTIETKAARLADELADDAEFHWSDGLDDRGPAYISWEEPGGPALIRISVEEAVRGYLEEALRGKKEEFSNPDGLDNLDLLIEMASGAGPGDIDFGHGPA